MTMEEEIRFEAQIEGVVTAVSHSIIIRNEILFLAEFLCNGKPFHICFRHKSHQCWRSLLRPGARYTITDLRYDFLYKKQLSVLHTRTASTLKQIDNQENDGHWLLSRSKDLIPTYKGVVSRLVDADLGVWELNGKVFLVLSYLKDVTGEIWSRLEENISMGMPGENYSVRNISVEELQVSEKRNVADCLKIGDAITLHHVHRSVTSKGTFLTCCGRSMLLTEFDLPVRYSFSKSTSSLLDVLHLYNLPNLDWLMELKEDIIRILCPNIIDENLISKRLYHNEKSALTILMEAAVSHGYLQKEFRSLFKEFVLEDHQCPVNKDTPPPFNLTKIKALKDEAAVEDMNKGMKNGLSKLWNFYLVWKDHFQTVIGLMNLDESGIYKLCDNIDSIKVQIIGTHMPLLSLRGAVVAFFKYIVVCEEFNIMNSSVCGNLKKIYLLVKLDDIVILKPATPPDLRGAQKIDMTIISKSNMLFSVPQIRFVAKQTPESKFFFVTAVMTTQEDNGKNNSWKGYFRFTGKLSKYYPCIVMGHKYIISINDTSNPNIILRKSHGNILLSPLEHHCDRGECTYIPEGTMLIHESVKDFSLRPTSDNIEDILGSHYDKNGLITVTGFVRDRKLETPKFESEMISFPEKEYNELNIGIPGSKTFRILLSESTDSASNAIWVYIIGLPFPYLQRYPLGLLPFTKVTISALIRKMSMGNKQIYLQSTNITNFTLLSFPSHGVVPLDNYCKYRSLNHALEKKGSFKVVAQLHSIQYVIINNLCIACDSVMLDGYCHYIGCSSRDGGKLSLSAKIMIEDGTGQACVTLNTLKHFQIIMELPEETFSSLCEEIIANCESLSYRCSKMAKENLKGRGVASEAAFAFICSRRNSRPLKFLCRPFTRQSEKESSPELFCIDVIEFNPNTEKEILDCDI